jgi:dTDP-4-amino-4,6-dideoxygalactose transaminase
LSPPDVGEGEQAYVRQAFESNWISSSGPHLNAFEAAVCDYTGAKSAVALSSGTAALHLALILAGVEAGDHVLCSTFTFAASAFAICYIGAIPIFIDSGTETWNMDPGLCVEEIHRLAKEGRPPKAVMPVHLYGQSVDLDPILDACSRFNIPLIEDAAEALGTDYKGRHCGTLGKLGVFSFNGNKIMTTSGGGMLVSDDSDLIQRACFLSTQAKEPTDDRHYLHKEIGFNYRMSNVLAAIGRGQLERIESFIEARRRIFDRYQESFVDLPGVSFMPEANFGRSTRWLTCILISPQESPVSPGAIQVLLEAENIESRPLWMPMHLQPIFRDARCVGGSVSERLYQTGLCLPSGSSLDPESQERVIAVFRKAFE